MPKNNQITLNYIPDPDYARLKAEAAAPNGERWLRECAPLIAEQLDFASVATALHSPLSLCNLVRILLQVPPSRGPGNPLGSSRKGAKQPKGKQRGVRRTREEIEQAKQRALKTFDDLQQLLSELKEEAE